MLLLPALPGSYAEDALCDREAFSRFFIRTQSVAGGFMVSI